MKCVFCNNRCRLLRSKEAPDVSRSEQDMVWSCDNHPVRAFQHVHVRRVYLRGGKKLHNGTLREWEQTALHWVNEKKFPMIAYYYYDEGANSTEGTFVVYRVEADRKSIGHNGQEYDDPLVEVMTLDYIPKEITPENIAHKISHLAIFS